MKPSKPMTDQIEIVPAILKNTLEKIAADWRLVQNNCAHIQLDITDGVFAGNGTFRDIPRFKQLPSSEKAEIHLMVHRPAYYVDDLIDLSPARIIFHFEAFTNTQDINFVYTKLRQDTQSELALALNPDSPNDRLYDLVNLIDYVMFLGVNPGYANQVFNPVIYQKVGSWHDRYPEIPIAVDGHVSKDTIGQLVQAGANILCANSAIFNHGDPVENIRQLRLLATAALGDKAG